MSDLPVQKDEILARPGTVPMVRAGAKPVVQALLVWAFSNTLAVLVYVFGQDFHSHPVQDVITAFSAEAVFTILLLRRYKIAWSEAGFCVPIPPVQWASNIAFIVFLNLSLAGMMVLAKVPDTTFDSFPLAAKTLVLCLGGPVVEESFVRGWFQTAFLRAIGSTRTTAAILASSFLFAVIHAFAGVGIEGSAMLMIGALLSGVIFARVRQRSGSLLPPIVLHIIYNVTGLFVADPLWRALTHHW